MSSLARTSLFLVSAAGLAMLFAWGFRNLPPMGDYRGPYGYVVSQVAFTSDTQLMWLMRSI